MITKEILDELYVRVGDVVWDPEPQYDETLSHIDKDDLDLLYYTLKKITQKEVKND